MRLITCKNVAFAYEHNIIVENLNFTVDSGDYLCIVGENGSGKSTLIKGLLGLKQPACGSIIREEQLQCRDIGYLPQKVQVQRDFPASVFEVVLSGRLGGRGIKPFYNKEDRLAAEENIRRMRLENMRNACFRNLSGGQQQRVLLARALCAASKLLLLDEPVAGLDPVVTAEMYQLIAKANRQLNMAVVMVSHDVGSAVKYAGSILHLQKSQCFFGSTGDYAASDIGRLFLRGDASV